MHVGRFCGHLWKLFLLKSALFIDCGRFRYVTIQRALQTQLKLFKAGTSKMTHGYKHILLRSI